MRTRYTALLLFASLLSAAGCGEPTSQAQTGTPRHRAWQLTGDGVLAGNAAVPIPGWIRAEDAYACAPELAVGPKGEAVITSNVVPTLWRVDPETLAVTEHPLTLDEDSGRDVGFSGLVYSSQHAAYFAVSHAHGTLWRIDTQLKRGQKIPLSQPVSSACGLAIRAHAVQPKSIRLAGLCAYSQRSQWRIDLAPDQRSAYVMPITTSSMEESTCAIS
jgi:hypothetical protein